jgi:predicted transcriptional regulator
VSPTHRYTFWIDDAQEAALKELIERPGEESAVSFHLRQAIREYLERKGVTMKAERQRVAARKRP